MPQSYTQEFYFTVVQVKWSNQAWTCSEDSVESSLGNQRIWNHQWPTRELYTADCQGISCCELAKLPRDHDNWKTNKVSQIIWYRKYTAKLKGKEL